MIKRVAILVSLVVFGTVLAKISGTNELGIPLLPIYAFGFGLSVAFLGLFTLLIPRINFAPYCLLSAAIIIWISLASAIAALLTL